MFSPVITYHCSSGHYTEYRTEQPEDQAYHGYTYYQIRECPEQRSNLFFMYKNIAKINGHYNRKHDIQNIILAERRERNVHCKEKSCKHTCHDAVCTQTLFQYHRNDHISYHAKIFDFSDREMLSTDPAVHYCTCQKHQYDQHIKHL